MRGLFGSNIWSFVLVTALVLNPGMGLARQDPYAGRLFLIADENEVFNERGFLAKCGNRIKKFIEITSDEAKQVKREVILLMFNLHEFEKHDDRCFTEPGKFFRCDQKGSMETTVDDGRPTCEIIAFELSELNSATPQSDLSSAEVATSDLLAPSSTTQQGGFFFAEATTSDPLESSSTAQPDSFLPNVSQVERFQSYLFGVVNHIKECALIYTGVFAFATLLTAHIAYKIHQKNRQLSLTLENIKSRL